MDTVTRVITGTSTRVRQMEAYHKAYEEASAQDRPVAYIRYLASEARVWFSAAEGTTSLEYFKSLREVRAAQKMRELMLVSLQANKEND